LPPYFTHGRYDQNPEHQPNIDSPGAKSSDMPKEKTIYLAGWEKTTKGITMAFVTDDGEPFYSKSYTQKAF
jgi:hypothetical protein